MRAASELRTARGVACRTRALGSLVHGSARAGGDASGRELREEVSLREGIFTLLDFHQDGYGSIRAVDREHIVFTEPFVLFNFGGADTSLSP